MQLKVLTLNIWNGGRLLSEAIDFLHKHDADLMLLQEVYNGTNPAFDDRFRTVSLLQQAFPEHEAAFTPLYLDTRELEGPIEEGQLLLSRWPLTSSRGIFFDIPYGEYDQDHYQDFSNFPAMVQVTSTTIDGRTFTLLNVHGPVNYDGTADTDRRLRMRDQLLAEIGPAELVIMGGDFNVRPQTQTIRSLAQVLKPVFNEGELTSTFNMQRKTNPGFATAAVDYLMVSPSLSVVERACPMVDISDHLPLVATLEL